MDTTLLVSLIPSNYHCTNHMQYRESCASRTALVDMLQVKVDKVDLHTKLNHQTY